MLCRCVSSLSEHLHLIIEAKKAVNCDREPESLDVDVFALHQMKLPSDGSVREIGSLSFWYGLKLKD